MKLQNDEVKNKLLFEKQIGTTVIMSSLFPNLGTNIKSKPKREFRKIEI
jgi:hypothetical protein